MFMRYPVRVCALHHLTGSLEVWRGMDFGFSLCTVPNYYTVSGFKMMAYGSWDLEVMRIACRGECRGQSKARVSRSTEARIWKMGIKSDEESDQ